jgi:hypothetical protein
MGWAVLRFAPGALGVCALVVLATAAAAGPHDALIAKHAATHGVPESLVRRVIQIESRGNPRAVSKGNFGLMQIRLGTARAMGYGGTAEGLLDADTNLTYAVKYLAHAYRAAGCSEARAISFYQSGFYKKGGTKCAASSNAQTGNPEPLAAAQAIALRSVFPVRETSQLPADALRPRVVQVQTIVKPKDAAPAQVAAKADKMPPQTVAKAPDPETPWSPPVAREPASALLQDLPLPKSRPAITNHQSAPELAAIDTNSPGRVNATAYEQDAKPEPRSSRRHTRRSRIKPDESGFMTSSKQLTSSPKASRKSAPKDAGPPIPVSY